MKEDGVEQVTGKFGDASDRIIMGKPCDNCNCGLKEKYDEAQKKALEDGLENGQVESNCGKCYMGDAFRCASCPYRGKPAFEPGDKVKLMSENVQQTGAQKAEDVRTTQTGSTKVVLEL